MSDLSTTSSSTYLDFNALTRLKGEAAQDPSKAIRQTSEQFEAYFIQQMMKTMRESIEKSDLVDGGNMDMYQDLMDKEISLQMVKRGGMGLADMMERQMKQAQGLSTQDALQLHKNQAMPMTPAREAMSLKPEAIKAYELERISGYKLDRVTPGDQP
ncbi:rod-binding protein [Limnohabitans sp. 2KL-27]|jgi:flagellar protein FlgJ|uniref:rod-binding protein n=1 Tax=Limnohabitans sp. 2KL-27 TaxID=1100705 RepID=UPI000B1ADAA9|nr:rod-binding protein [Limnohabitans sp. 2KL-27]